MADYGSLAPESEVVIVKLARPVWSLDRRRSLIPVSRQQLSDILAKGAMPWVFIGADRRPGPIKSFRLFCRVAAVPWCA